MRQSDSEFQMDVFTICFRRIRWALFALYVPDRDLSLSGRLRPRGNNSAFIFNTFSMQIIFSLSSVVAIAVRVQYAVIIVYYWFSI